MKKFSFRSLATPLAAALALTFTLGVSSVAFARHSYDDDSSSGGGRWDDDSSSSGCRRNCGGGGGGDPVPEIDPNAARAAAVMLAGGLAVVRYRGGR